MLWQPLSPGSQCSPNRLKISLVQNTSWHATEKCGKLSGSQYLMPLSIEYFGWSLRPKNHRNLILMLSWMCRKASAAMKRSCIQRRSCCFLGTVGSKLCKAKAGQCALATSVDESTNNQTWFNQTMCSTQLGNRMRKDCTISCKATPVRAEVTLETSTFPSKPFPVLAHTWSFCNV